MSTAQRQITLAQAGDDHWRAEIEPDGITGSGETPEEAIDEVYNEVIEGALGAVEESHTDAITEALDALDDVQINQTIGTLDALDAATAEAIGGTLDAIEQANTDTITGALDALDDAHISAAAESANSPDDEPEASDRVAEAPNPLYHLAGADLGTIVRDAKRARDSTEERSPEDIIKTHEAFIEARDESGAAPPSKDEGEDVGHHDPDVQRHRENIQRLKEKDEDAPEAE